MEYASRSEALTAPPLRARRAIHRGDVGRIYRINASMELWFWGVAFRLTAGRATAGRIRSMRPRLRCVRNMRRGKGNQLNGRRLVLLNQKKRSE